MEESVKDFAMEEREQARTDGAGTTHAKIERAQADPMPQYDGPPPYIP